MRGVRREVLGCCATKSGRVTLKGRRAGVRAGIWEKSGREGSAAGGKGGGPTVRAPYSAVWGK